MSLGAGHDSKLGEHFPALMDALPDAVLVVDHERKLVAANRRYREIFGERRVDLIDSGCTESAHRADARSPESARCVACDVIESRESRSVFRQFLDQAGAARRFEATVSPMLGPDGAVTHVVEVWRDITERSRLEVQLSHSERLASVGILSAGVAHEINNPLASILAGVETLGRWLGRAQFTPEDVREAGETVQLLEREIDRCRETTQKLMLLGRSYDTAPSWVDLNRAVRDTVALLGYELRKRGIDAVEVLEPELPQLWAREAAIRGICMNLMMNAVQAMSDGGRLTVTSRRDRDHAVLVIEDTGSGIAPEHLERIWDPFFTTKPVGQGTGLGLSITHRIITRHGGRIRVSSESGRGARFEVELPFHGTGGDV